MKTSHIKNNSLLENIENLYIFSSFILFYNCSFLYKLFYKLCGFVGINSSELVAQWDNGSSTVECLAALTTNILFECNAYDTWEGNPGLGYGEASSYLLNFFVNFDDPCGVSYYTLARTQTHTTHISYLFVLFV